MTKSLYLALGLASLVAGCTSKNENPSVKIESPEPFQSALVAYQNKPDNEENCGCSVETYVRRSVERDSHGKIIKVSETEITCNRGYFPALAQSARFIIADRELFPDGRVNVLWDPGNKYKSTQNPGGNR